jgi:cell wall-associated NlpC family hydrolase
MRKSRGTLVVALMLAGLAAGLVISQSAESAPLALQKANAKAKAKKIRAQLAVLDNNLEVTIQQYDLAQVKLQEAQAKVAAATRQLEVARFKLQVARATLNNRVVAMYKERPTDFFDVVFASKSFDEMVTQLHAVRELSANDSEIVDNVERYTAAAKEKRDDLVVARAQARGYVKQVEANKAAIESQMAARKQMLKGVEKEITRIEREEAAAAARAAAALGTVWRNPRQIPHGPLPAGHPEVVRVAQEYLGIPYVYGAADPRVGFDCSGLVMYCYAQIGITLPHYSGYQQNMGVPVPMNALIPGDLVFIGYPVSHHVALYYGGGLVIEAPHTGDVVKYSSVSRFEYAVRLP